MNEPTLLDLFSGIGGFSLAFESVGFRTVGFVEWNSTKQIVLNEWWPDGDFYGDIKEFSGTQFRAKHGRIDVVTGGVPCQPASALGQQRGTSDERWMWPEAIRVVRETRPGYFIFENPPALLTLEHGQAWNGIVSGLAALGYDLWWDVIPAAVFGAGHLRERVILVGSDATRIRERIQANEDHTKPIGRHAWNESSGNGNFETTPDANCQRRPKTRLCLPVRESEGFEIRVESSANGCSATLTNPNDTGLQGHSADEQDWRERKSQRRPVTTPDLRGRVFGDQWWHEANTGIPVLVDGLPGKLVEAASLCAGDSIVPQVAEVFAEAIYKQLRG